MQTRVWVVVCLVGSVCVLGCSQQPAAADVAPATPAAASAAATPGIPPASPAPAATSKPAGDDEEKLNDLVRAKFQQIVPVMDFEEIPLKDVIEYIRAVSNVNVSVNWKALTLAGLDRTTPVTVHLQKVTVDRALKVILRDVGGPNPLQYIIDDGVVTISTRDDLARQVFTRVYDVRDLVALPLGGLVSPDAAPWGRTMFVDLPARSSPAQSQPAENNQSGNRSGNQTDLALTRADMVNELIATIRRTIDPPSWTGGEATIREMHGQLIITQNFTGHDQMRELLASLRESRQLQIGFAVVRVLNVQGAAALQTASLAGGDLAKALTDGEKAGQWIIDRCSVAHPAWSEIILIRRTGEIEPASVGQSPIINQAGQKPAKPPLTGYEIGVAAISKQPAKDGGKIALSLACGAAWFDTTLAGRQARHDIFDFALTPGEVKLIRIIPATATEGAVYAIVWLPKEQ